MQCQRRGLRRNNYTKVPTWNKDISLETYIKQVEIWDSSNSDVLENTQYQDFVELLKINKDIRGLPKYLSEHMLLVLNDMKRQTVRNVIESLKKKYGCTRLEKLEQCVKDWLKFKTNYYDYEDEFIQAMEEIQLRKEELKVTDSKWFSTWYFGKKY